MKLQFFIELVALAAVLRVFHREAKELLQDTIKAYRRRLENSAEIDQEKEL